MSTTVVVALIGSVPATIAAVAGVMAVVRGTQNAAALTQVKLQTNGAMEEKIRRAVFEVFQEHRGQVTEAVMAESVRHLLDALINEDAHMHYARGTDPYPSEGRIQ